MMTSEFDNFKLMLKIKPQLFVNKKVLIDDKEVKILDVSLDGSYIFVEKLSQARDWKPVSELTKEKVVIDITNEDFSIEAAKIKPLSVNTLVSFMNDNQKSRGDEFMDIIGQLRATASTFNTMKELSASPLQKAVEHIIEQKVASMAAEIVDKLTCEIQNTVTPKDKEKIAG